MATRQTNFRLPLDTIQHLRAMAKAEHRTMTSMVISLIEDRWHDQGPGTPAWMTAATPPGSRRLRSAVTQKQRAAAARQAKAQARMRKEAYEDAPEDWTR